MHVQKLLGTEKRHADWGVVMNEKVNVMDLSIDILTAEEFTDVTKEYFEQDNLKTMLFLTTKIVEETVADIEYKDMISKFHLILPGEEAVLSLHHVNVLKAGGMITNYQCFYSFLEYVERTKKTVYLIGEDFVKMESFMELCAKSYSDLQVVGTFIKDNKINDERLLNDINTVCPDVIIVSISPQMQERWIIENSAKLSAKICVGVGGIFNPILEEYETSCEGANRSFLYRTWNKTRKNIQKVWQKRIFKMEFAYYNDKHKKGH